MSGSKRVVNAETEAPIIKIRETWGWNEVAFIEGRPGFDLDGQAFLPDGNTIAGVEVNFEIRAVYFRLWRAPSWEK